MTPPRTESMQYSQMGLMQPSTFTFMGMNTAKDRTELQTLSMQNGGGELVLARDVDITDTGVVTARAGYRKTIDMVNCHSLWSHPMVGMFAMSGATLYTLSTNLVATKLADLACDDPVAFEFVNDVVVFSNGQQIGFIKGGVVVWPTPPPATVAVTLDTGVTAEVDSELDPVPAGQFLAMTAHGSLLVAAGNELVETEAYNLEAVHRLRGYTPLDSRITLLRTVDDGAWVGTQTAIWFRSGAYDDVRWVKKADYPAITGVAVVSEAALVGVENMMPYGKVVWLATERGICVAGNGGQFINLSYGVVSVGKGISGSALLRMQNGQTDFLAAIDGVSGQHNPRINQAADYDEQ